MKKILAVIAIVFALIGLTAQSGMAVTQPTGLWHTQQFYARDLNPNQVANVGWICYNLGSPPPPQNPQDYIYQCVWQDGGTGPTVRPAGTWVAATITSFTLSSYVNDGWTCYNLGRTGTQLRNNYECVKPS